MGGGLYQYRYTATICFPPPSLISAPALNRGHQKFCCILNNTSPVFLCSVSTAPRTNSFPPSCLIFEFSIFCSSLAGWPWSSLQPISPTTPTWLRQRRVGSSFAMSTSSGRGVVFLPVAIPQLFHNILTSCPQEIEQQKPLLK